MKIKLIYTLSTLLAVLFSSAVQSQTTVPKLLLELTNNKKLLKYNLAEDASYLIYQTEHDEIRNVKISTNENYAALIETTYYNNKPENNLTIIDGNGNIIRKIDKDVQFFDWSPTESKLAFITGTYYEGGIGFKPIGVYIFNIEENHIEEIKTSGFSPYRLNWLHNDHENSIYLEVLSPDPDIKIIKYNLTRRQFEKTSVKSIDLSPDGQYYSLIDNECYCTKFFAPKTNSFITHYQINETGHPIGWAYTKSHLFIFSKDEYQKINKSVVIKGEVRTGTISGRTKSSQNSIYDISSDIKVQEFNGLLQSVRKLQPLFVSKEYLISIPLDNAKGTGKNQRILKDNIITKTIPEEYLNEQ
jgi:hypothetical protein